MFLDNLKSFYEYYCDFDEIDKVEKPNYADRVAPLIELVNDPKVFRTFSASVDISGKNGFPIIAKDEDFDALENPTFYHGASRIKHLACFLADYDYHKGDGYYGSGLYCTNDIDYAKAYSHHLGRNVLRFKLSPDAKVISRSDISIIQSYICNRAKYLNTSVYYEGVDGLYEKLCPKLSPEVQERVTILIDFLSSAYNGEEKGFVNDVLYNISTIGALLGYDVIEGSKFTLILNRGKIVVSEHEFNRITNATRLYRHGIINFEHKKDEDFIRE